MNTARKVFLVASFATIGLESRNAGGYMYYQDSYMRKYSFPDGSYIVVDQNIMFWGASL